MSEICNSINNLTGCYLDLGRGIWPTFPKGGAFILTILIVTAGLLGLRYLIKRANRE